MFKRIIAIVSVVLLMISFNAVIVSAIDLDEPVEEEGDISEYETVVNHVFHLYSTGTKANITIRIDGKSGVKFKNGTLKLYKYVNSSWTTVKTWSNLSSSTSIFMFNDNSVTIQSGSLYKAKLTITAYNSSTNEPITLSKTSTL